MAIKVIQWATGSVGTEAIRLILDHPDLELVGVFAYSKSKSGVDAGTLVGRDPVGVAVTNDRSAIMALEADCVVHAASMLHEARSTVADNDVDVEDLLRSGKNVVSVAGYIWPALRGAEVEKRLEEGCQVGGTSLLGTGINPGYYLDRVGPVVSSLCHKVEHIKARENWDASTYPSPELLFDMVGFGKPAEWLTADLPSAQLLAGWFNETLAATVHSLGGEVERFERSCEYGLATRDLTLPAGGTIAGTLGAVGWTWTAIVDGKPLVSVTDRWIADWDIPGWGGEPSHNWKVEVTGEPSITVSFDFTDTYPRLPGDEAFDRVTAATTAAVAVNALPEVCAAPLGLMRRPPVAACRSR